MGGAGGLGAGSLGAVLGLEETWQVGRSVPK